MTDPLLFKIVAAIIFVTQIAISDYIFPKLYEGESAKITFYYQI